MTTPRLRAYTYLIIVSAIWGIAGAVVKHTLTEITPFVFLIYRFFLTLVAFVPVMIIKKEKFPTDKKLLLNLVLLSLLGSTVNLGLLFYGIKYTSSIDQTLISATSPILIVAAAVIFLKEQVTKRERLGIIITIIGTILITIQSVFESNFFTSQGLLGNSLVFASNLAWVGYIILSKKALRAEVSPLVLTAILFFVGFITLLPFAIFEAHGIGGIISQVTKMSLGGQLGVMYMAYLSGGLAYFLYQVGQKSIEASEASIFTYLQPIFLAPVAILWLHESFTPVAIIGTAVVTVGVILSEYKNTRQKV